MQELDATQRLLLDQLKEEYQQRHGVAVEYLKRAVGEGEEYSNGVAKVVISSTGAWFECVDQPMEFSGAAGGCAVHHFVTDSDALSLLDRLFEFAESAAPDDTRLCRLFVLYEPGGIVDEKGAHVIHFEPHGRYDPVKTRHVGQFRPGQLPLLYRCRFDTKRPIKGVSFQQGVVLCLSGLGERNLVVEMPYSGHDVRDLANPPINMMPQ